MKSLGRCLRRAIIIATGFVAGSRCPACGVRSVLVSQRVLWPGLIAEWELSPEWVRHFDEREGMHCGFCHCSLRDRHLGQGIIAVSGIQAGSLRELCRLPLFQAWRVAEINAAGGLHRFLEKLPRLAYSEFGSSAPEMPSENLMALTYADDSFDLVITSETLEHVPDIHVALKEIYRILKPGGWHVFSVPVVWERKATRQRASQQGWQIINHLPPSFHGSAGKTATDMLVFYEFGSDFTDFCRAAGFEVRLLSDSGNPALATFLAQKPVRDA